MEPTAAIPLTPCCPQGSGSDAVALLIVTGLLVIAHGVVQWRRGRKGNTTMSKWKISLWIGALLLALGVTVMTQQDRHREEETTAPAQTPGPAAAIEAGLPALLELGADSCIPCKQMKPIIDDLKATYEGQLHVDFIDVWKNPEEGKKYGVRVIPLQIFFDTEGQERFRHEGFFSKEDILAKWTELGVELKTP